MPHDDLGALIQRADLNQRLTKALEIKGHKSPIRTLGDVVGPVVIVEDLTRQAEWVTPTERRLASSEIIAPVVGQNGILAISNPLGSGVVAIVEKITAHGTAGSINFLFGLVNPLGIPVNPAALYFLDRRIAGAPTCRAFKGTDAVLQIVNQYLSWQGSNAIATPWFDVTGVVIQPGEAFGIQAFQANVPVNPTIWLQEIPL